VIVGDTGKAGHVRASMFRKCSPHENLKSTPQALTSDSLVCYQSAVATLEIDMFEQEIIQKKKRRALVGLAIGLMLFVIQIPDMMERS
jgi:hypothetical protein